MWIPGKTNLIGDGISRSLSADEGSLLLEVIQIFPRSVE